MLCVLCSNGFASVASAAAVATAAGEPTAPAPSLATQVSSMAAGTWQAIVADNTARAVDPERDPNANPAYPKAAPYHGNSGYNGIWVAWNSGVLAPSHGPCGAILYFGGGHADYWGNEVIALNLCGGARWTAMGASQHALQWPDQLADSQGHLSRSVAGASPHL